MLILTRRVGEAVLVGEGDNAVTLTVLGVKGNQVRVGVAAPKAIKVLREELLDRAPRQPAADG